MKSTANKQKSTRSPQMRGAPGDLYCVDISKHYFHVNRYTAHGELQVSHALTRSKFEQLVRDPQRPAGMWMMEACAGSHHWGRTLLERGDKVKLLPPQFVALRRVGNKNDSNDAAAIFATHIDPRVRPVPVKTLAQQDDAVMHSVRRQLVGQRVATLNALRAHQAERGWITGKGLAPLKALLSQHLDSTELSSPTQFQQVLSCAKAVLEVLDTQLAVIDRIVSRHAASTPAATLLMDTPGIGPVTASAVVTEHPRGVDRYHGCRQFAGGIGLSPGEHSTGGKTQMTGITKRGNVYLRTLLVQGAQTVLNQACPKAPRSEVTPLRQRPPADHDLHDFARRMVATGKRRAVVVCAIANRMARIIYAILKTGEVYRPRRNPTRKEPLAA